MKADGIRHRRWQPPRRHRRTVPARYGEAEESAPRPQGRTAADCTVLDPAGPLHRAGRSFLSLPPPPPAARGGATPRRGRCGPRLPPTPEGKQASRSPRRRRRSANRTTGRPPPVGVTAPADYDGGRRKRAGAPHWRRCFPSSMSPTVAAPLPRGRIASTCPRPLPGRALFANQRPPQKAGSTPRVRAGPGLSALSQVRGRGGRCRPSPLATPKLIASATPLTRRRHGLCRRRRPTSIRRPSRPTVLRVGPRVQRVCIPVSGMTRLRVPARAASPRRVSGQAAWDDSPNGRPGSHSRT